MGAFEARWMPEVIYCDCCQQEMEYIGLSLYQCNHCNSDCDGSHGRTSTKPAEAVKADVNDSDSLENK